jgi:hypothetical protein
MPYGSSGAKACRPRPQVLSDQTINCVLHCVPDPLKPTSGMPIRDARPRGLIFAEIPWNRPEHRDRSTISRQLRPSHRRRGLQRSKIVTTVTVNDVAVESMTENSAVVLVATTTEAKTAEATEPDAPGNHKRGTSR